MTLIQFLSFMGLPSAVVGFGFTVIIMMIHNQNKKAEKRDKLMFLVMQLSYSGMELSEATAISYKNQRCNGEISSALTKAQIAKSEYNKCVMEIGASKL